MKVCKTRAIGANRKHHARARAAPSKVVPYRFVPDNITPAQGLAPSLMPFWIEAEKLCRFVKPLPSVPMANSVP